MNDRQKQKLQAHYEKYLHTPFIVKVDNENLKFPVDVLIYPPTKEYPFWKLMTQGASDFVQSNGERHEYVVFVSAQKMLLNQNGTINPVEFNWYYNLLMNAAVLPTQNNLPAPWRTIVRVKNMQESEMKGYMLFLPVGINDTQILYCELNANKKAMLLCVMPLTQEEIEFADKEGNVALEKKFLPLDGTPAHFFAEPTRTFKVV